MYFHFIHCINIVCVVLCPVSLTVTITIGMYNLEGRWETLEKELGAAGMSGVEPQLSRLDEALSAAATQLQDARAKLRSPTPRGPNCTEPANYVCSFTVLSCSSLFLSKL